MARMSFDWESKKVLLTERQIDMMVKQVERMNAAAAIEAAAGQANAQPAVAACKTLTGFLEAHRS